LEYETLVEKFGEPTIGHGPCEGQPSRFVILGLGKLGGREPNYHSDLAVAFLYEAEGVTQPLSKSRRDQRTTNNHFFTQLAQRFLKEIAQLTPKGRLYTIDAQLRPIGVGGAMALTLADFEQHFASGVAPLWQWQVLCQARPLFGDTSIRAAVENVIQQLLTNRPWQESDAEQFRRSRLDAERGASPGNLKRAPGGTLDVESLVQMLQLRHAGRHPSVLTANTQQALDRLAAAGVLAAKDAEALGDAYRWLRRVESGLRLLQTSARHDLPESPLDLGRLALLMGHSNPDKLRDTCLALMSETRSTFDRLVPPAPVSDPA
jgi:glutamate-ammonia-ligase adenylyltransferase